jgi:hypothetical protein
MSTRIDCPQCGAGLQVPDHVLGKKIRCPKCQGVVPTPAPAAAEPAEADPVRHGLTPAEPAGPRAAPSPEPPAAKAIDVRPVRKKRRPRRRIGLPGIAVEGGVVKVAVGLVCLVVFGVLGYIAVRAAFRVRPPSPIPAERWQPFEAAGRCKALLPGTPERKNQPVVAGMSVVLHMTQPSRDAVFGVGYSEGLLPPERRNLPAEQLLNDSCDGSAANLAKMGGREVRRESVQLGPYPGKQLVIYIPQADGHMMSRCYLAGGRLYIIMCGGSGYDTSHPDVRRFFESFEILDPGKPPTEPPSGPAPPVARGGAPAPAPASPAPEGAWDVHPPFAADPKLVEPGGTVYLSDLSEFDVQRGPWPLGKGNMGDPEMHAVVVGGHRSPHGLGLHPPDTPAVARVRYALGKRARVFKTAVALNDTAPATGGGVRFVVIGDGKELWQSGVVRQPGRTESCAVDVSTVEVLELRVRAEGSHFGGHAVWVEPRLFRDQKAADEEPPLDLPAADAAGRPGR